jgi:hypothetical protein
MCSCLAEPIQACQGFAENPVDPTSTCDGGAVVVLPEGGDATASDGGPTDSGALGDAADAASE